MMTNEQDSVKAAERVRAWRSDFLNEWEIGVLPLDEERRSVEAYAFGFAQSVLKAGFILNGGGLLTFPAAVALFGIKAEASRAELLTVGALFVGGVTFCWAASIVGYFTSSFYGRSIGMRREAAAKRLRALYWPMPAPEKEKVEVENLDVRSRRREVAALTFEYVGVVLAFAAFAAFVTGCFLGGELLIAPPA